MKRIAGFVDFLLGKHSARNAAVINALLSSVSKALGYVRTLLMAYLFGASAFIDAYWVVSGAVGFISGTIERSVEAAIIPKLVQNDSDTASSLFAATMRAVLVFIVLLFLLILIYPVQFITIFARTFDPLRLALSAGMVKYIVPWGVAAVIMSMLGSWANYQNRFSVSSIVYSLSNVFLIFALLLFYPLLREMALPISQSVSFVILMFLMWFAVGGVPLQTRTELAPGLRRSVGRDALFSMVWSGSIFIYSVVDRYFASSLPVGNVSAISYAQLIFSHPLGFVSSTLTIYFVRASEAAKSKIESDSLFFVTLLMACSYFLPAAILLSLLAAPVIKLLLGYGAFNAQAVALTAPCLAVTALGLPVMACNMIVGKYALAEGRLRTLVIWSYIGVVGNAILDWLFVGPFGAPGLCAATTIMWHVSTLCLMVIFAPDILKKLAKSLRLQAVVVAMWAMPLYFMTRQGVITPILLGAAVGLAHLLLCERFGLFDQIPKRWRLTTIVKGLWARLVRRAG